MYNLGGKTSDDTSEKEGSRWMNKTLPIMMCVQVSAWWFYTEDNNSLLSHTFSQCHQTISLFSLFWLKWHALYLKPLDVSNFESFLKVYLFPARRKFHSFPVRRRMLSVSSVSLSGDLSREAWANLQRLVLLGSMPRWAFVSSASPRRASHEPERRDWMSAFLKGRSHRCLSRTLSSPRQPSANQQNPAWESYRGRASCDSVVWKKGAVFLLLLFFFVSRKNWSRHESSSRQRGVRN